MHHFGSGIWSQMRLSTGPSQRHRAGDDHQVALPRLGRKTSAPNRAISKRDVLEAIISMAQHASPKVSGHIADLRAQLNT